MIQIKTFDQSFQPLKNVEVSLNGKEYVLIDDKGVAFIEMSDNELPVKTVKIKNQELEPSSWNFRQGIVEIVVRRKNYQTAHLILKYSNNAPVTNQKVTFKGRKTVTVMTNNNGRFEIPLGLDEKVNSANQFAIAGHEVINIHLSDREKVLIVERIKSREELRRTQADRYVPPKKQARSVDLSELDSIQSLEEFYSFFKNYPIKDLREEYRQRVDSKFRDLVSQQIESPEQLERYFISKISATSPVTADVKNLISQAMLEDQTLNDQRAEFESKIKMVNDKLARGISDLEADTLAVLLSDLTMLDEQLMASESRFNQNRDDYRQIINAMMEEFFDVHNTENRLSELEAKRMEEQRILREQMLIFFGTGMVIVILVILLIFSGIKLRRQNKKLVNANTQIKIMNENLHEIAFRHTRSERSAS